MLPKFKMAARGQQSHSPPYGDVQVSFQGFTEIQNGPSRTNFNFLVGAKTQTRLHKSRSSRSELEFDLSNFV